MERLFGLSEDEMFVVYKAVKRHLQKGYYRKRSPEQIEKRKVYMRNYKRKGKRVENES